jgi:MSHA biogenesis protein MshQ
MPRWLVILIASLLPTCGLGCSSTEHVAQGAGTPGGSSAGGAATGGGGSGGTEMVGSGGTVETGGSATGGTGTPDGSSPDSGVTGGGGTAMLGSGGTVGTGGSTTGDAGGVDFSEGCAVIMHMDETSWCGATGEVIDSCGNNNGTAVKGSAANDQPPNTSADGYFGRAGAFDNTNDCVQIPDDPSLSPTTQLTMAAWIFPTALNPASNGIIAKRTDFQTASTYTMFLWNNGGADYKLWTDIGQDRYGGNIAISTNLWYHVAVVFDGSLPVNQRVRLYVNGTPAGQFAQAADTLPKEQSTLHVGCLPISGPAQEFSGKIDEVAIWTRALGSAEILQLFQANAPL